MEISSYDINDSTEESDSDYDSDHDCDEDMCIKYAAHAPDDTVLQSDVDLESDCGNEQKEDEEEDDEEEEAKDEKEDDNKHNGKEPHTIEQGEMVNASTHNVHIIIEDQVNMLAEHVQEMLKHTSRRQRLTILLRQHSPERHPQAQTPKTRPLQWLQHMGPVPH